MECLSHPDRGRVALRSGVAVTSSSSSRSRWKSAGCWRRVVALFPLQATFTAAATPTNADLGHGDRHREHRRRDHR